MIVVDADAQLDIELAAKCESFAFERTHRVGLANFGDDFAVAVVHSVDSVVDESCAASDVFVAFDFDALKSHSD